MSTNRFSRTQLSRWLCVATALVCASARAVAGPLSNGGVYISPNPVAAGQTLVLKNSIAASAATSNVTVRLEIHRITTSGTINPYAFYSNVLTGQTFAAGESKLYTQNYIVPASLISGTYTYTIKATDAAGTTTYLDLQRTVSPYIFTVNAAPNSTYLRGVNIMDLGIGTSLPGVYGTNYTKPSLQALQALSGRGLKVVRISFRWERIQPTLGGSLDTTYLGYLLQVLRDANTAGLKVIVDMHNYGRYTLTNTSPQVTYPFGDALGPTQAQYADAWKKISAAIKADTQAYAALYAYDIMNEPYGLVANPGTYTNKVLISSFETSTEGWTNNFPSTTSLTQATRNSQGSMKITVNPTSGSGLVFNVALSSTTKAIAMANGQTLEIKGFVPTTTPGTVKARIWMVDNAWHGSQSTVVPITKGTDFSMRFTPTSTVWTGNRGISVDFIVDGSDGSAPLVFYLDEVSQGTSAGARTDAQVWEDYSQAAVTGIRSLGDTSLIMVEGYNFASASNWPTNHPAKWITDSANNTMYQAHLYMDNDFSGQYLKTHAQELTLAQGQGYSTVGARAIARVQNFTGWLTSQGVPGYLGEFGWPNADSVGATDGTAWDADAEQLIYYLDGINLGMTVWGTGSWLSPTDNILNAYTLPPSRTFTVLSPGVVLERHL